MQRRERAPNSRAIPGPFAGAATVTLERPGWWPSGWSWPGEGPGRETVRLPEARSPGRSEEPGATFLATLVEAFAAERASVLRLDRDRGAWVGEREVAAPEASAAGDREFPAAGHPLTWCLREELVVQIPAGEITGDRGGEGWALAGPVAGRSRVLVILFHGTPPTRARRAMRPALRHLDALGVRPESRGR